MARERVKSAEAVLASRRFQLAQVDWRSLRAEAFEHFLAEVFRELGYHVEVTKASGDQGVDLILTKNARRLAVQVKGWADSVGNGAIQEVYAGMAFYGCDGCAAVTNSRFTGPARDLAGRLNCILVEDTDIPKLISEQIIL